MSYKEINIPVGKQYIKCKEFEPIGISKKTQLVVVHGWTSSDKKYLPLGDKLANIGIEVLVVNLRGHTNSPYNLRDFSRSQHEEDVVAAIKYSKKQHPDLTTALLGKSYGGYLSSIVAEREGVGVLILSQPALYPDREYDVPTKKLIDRDPNIFKQSRETPETNKALKGFSRFSGAVLFIESENDEEVPRATTRNYLKYSNNQTTSVVLSSADHSLSQEHWREDFYKEVADWLTEIGN
ncbi:alpha/beta fold hydrolase [Candidatus Woesebacteria bacterium]|nr:alpha/beta fold hydrolase [Candidatus Woesebacteria bacterium]